MKGCELVRRLSLNIVEEGRRELNRQDATTSRTRLLSGTFETASASAGEDEEYEQYFRRAK